jgi:UDP-glucose 4-epimerase
VNDSPLILVTGAAGFIGSHLCDGLLAAGHRVRGVDNLSSGVAANLDAARLHPQFEFVQGELTDASECTRACDGAHAVLHHAARVSVPASFADPGASRRDTLDTTRHLIDAARNAGVARFVLAGTAAVYGDAACPVPEDAPLSPLSPYGEAKRDAEAALRDSGLDGATLRYFNVYGTRQMAGSPYAGVITVFADRLQRGAPLTIHGDGAQKRDFVHVSDIVGANIAVLRHPSRLHGHPINIGTGRAVTMIELAETLGRVLDREPVLEHTAPREGDIRDSWADVTLALETLRWTAQVSLEQGLRDMLGGA